jgi:hypothetical protein
MRLYRYLEGYCRLNTTDSNKSSLSERQLKALPFFASCLTHEEACRRAEINRTTFYDWLKDPIFRAELKRLGQTVIDEAICILKSAATESVCKLLHLMRSGSSENIQRSAANDLLSHLPKYMQQVELEERVSALEAIATARKVK